MEQELEKRGIAAEAIVLSVTIEDSKENEMLVVILQIQVQPEKGRNFVSEIRECLRPSTIDRLNVGSRISVIYNPANFKEVMMTNAA